jgi:hypothetical protein
VTLPPAALDAACRIADDWPPLTPHQQAQLRVILAPTLEQLRRGQGAA